MSRPEKAERMGPNTGSQLIADGQWEEGLSVLWDDIDSGTELARVELAETFDANGLHSFSQDHWLFLLDNGSSKDLRERGAQGVASNDLWLRDYESARAVTLPFDELGWLRDAIQEKKDTDKLLNPKNLSEVASQTLTDEKALLWRLEHNADATSQFRLIEVRDAIGTVATVLNRSDSLRNHTDSDVPPLGVSRPGGEVLPQPELAWFQMAHACALLIGMFAEDDDRLHNEMFAGACDYGAIALGKMFLVRGSHDIVNAEERFVVTNIAAGLQAIRSFAGFIYGGLVS